MTECGSALAERDLCDRARYSNSSADIYSLLGGEIVIAGAGVEPRGELGIDRDASPKESKESTMKGRVWLEVFVENNESPPGISMAELAGDGLEDGLG